MTIELLQAGLHEAEAKEVLERTGAQDISSTGEATTEKGDKARVREVA